MINDLLECSPFTEASLSDVCISEENKDTNNLFLQDYKGNHISY